MENVEEKSYSEIEYLANAARRYLAIADKAIVGAKIVADVDTRGSYDLWKAILEDRISKVLPVKEETVV